MTRAGLPAAVLLVLPWLAACGGESHSRPPSYTLIDDMEAAGPNHIVWVGPPGSIPPHWWTASDCADLDRVAPPSFYVDPAPWAYPEVPSLHETMPGIMSAHGVRLRTLEPLVGTWGANLSAGFADTPRTGDLPPGGEAGCLQGSPTDFPAVPVDLTAYSGITFWARAESPGGRLMLVQLSDVNTDPRGGICQDSDASEAGSSTFCFNGFGALIQLTDTFTQYTLDFAQLTQRPGWGYHPPSGADWSRVYAMNFEMDLPSCTDSPYSMCAGGPPTLSFDVWIDDLYFVNK